MSYLTETMNRFNVARHQVEQEGSKQCAVVYLEDKMVFVSYTSIVGFTQGGNWYFTEEKHSVTTSQQVGAFHASRTYLPEVVFDEAMAGDAFNVIKDYNTQQALFRLQEANFKEEYAKCMSENSITPWLTTCASVIDSKLLNRLTREAKKEIMDSLVGHYDDNTFGLIKGYDKFKAKLTKAMKVTS